MSNRKQWELGVKDFAEHAKGVAEIYVLRQTDPRLLQGLFAGDRKCRRFLELGAKFFNALGDKNQWPDKRGPMCLTCDNPLSMKHNKTVPAALVVQTPWGTDWEHEQAACVVSGICRVCAAYMDDDQIGNAAIRAWGYTPTPSPTGHG